MYGIDSVYRDPGYRLGSLDNRKSQVEVMVLPTHMTGRNALLRAFRRLLNRTRYSAETDAARTPAVIDWAYGGECSSAGPESNTGTNQ